MQKPDIEQVWRVAEERKDKVVELVTETRAKRGDAFVDVALLVYTFMQVELLLHEVSHEDMVMPMRNNVMNVVKRVIADAEQIDAALEMAAQLSRMSTFTNDELQSAPRATH